MTRRKNPPAAKKATTTTKAAPRVQRPASNPPQPAPTQPADAAPLPLSSTLELPDTSAGVPVDELRAERDRTLREVYSLDSNGLFVLAGMTRAIEQHEAAEAEAAAAVDRERVQAEMDAAAAADAANR